MPKLTTVLLFLSIPFAGCFSLGTGNSTVLQEMSNNAKTKKAVLLENSGNATVDNSLQVSILDYGTQVSDKELGNTFTVDSNHGNATLNSASISFSWLSDDTLQIDYDSTLRTFIQNKEVDGVRVLYKAR